MNEILYSRQYRDILNNTILESLYLDVTMNMHASEVYIGGSLLSSHVFLKKKQGDIAIASVRPSVKLSPQKPLDEIQQNLVCKLLT